MAVVVVALLGAASPASAVAASPCGTRTGAAPQSYRHVIVIMEENRSIRDVIGGAGSAAAHAAPYVNQLAGQCGLAMNYHAATHPSHPNYMAVTGGVASAAASVTAPNIFSQVAAAGGTWRVYEGAMPSNCLRRPAFPYKPGHNPGLSYTGLAAACKAYDTNLSQLKRDIAGHHLPTYAFIAPDQCNDMEIACTSGASAITSGDTWLRTWMPRLLSTPGYTTGHTAIFITWDEGNHGHGTSGENCVARSNLSDPSCHVATLVVSPYVSAGLKSSVFLSHYSLLQTTERLLGLRPFLGHAADAGTVGMRTAFGF